MAKPLRTVIVVACLAAARGAAWPQDYPSRSVTTVVPVAPGGVPATLARALAPAIGSRAHRAWAFVSNTAYRASRTRLLALRTAPAP